MIVAGIMLLILFVPILFMSGTYTSVKELSLYIISIIFGAFLTALDLSGEVETTNKTAVMFVSEIGDISFDGTYKVEVDSSITRKKNDLFLSGSKTVVKYKVIGKVEDDE